ncbi:MAG TPA: carbonic anhydrase [Thermoanaerobaculia bacterium]|nr:carbonic anhydrase [Thermoanaerobaculia bacterium]
MQRLFEITSEDDIPSSYRETPIGDFLRYHALEAPFRTYTRAELLIGMCMDSRKHLRIPDYFAFILRTGGGNLRYSEFKVSYAVGVGGVRAIALLAHNNCGMVNLTGKREAFIDGLVENGGWDREWAEAHFTQFAPLFEIGNEIDFVLSEAKRLRQRYPKVTVAPLYYNVDESRIYGVREP